MIKVKCFLPNASEEISGIAFAKSEDGTMESVEALAPEVAAQFEGINGYVLIPSDDAPASKGRKSKAANPEAPE